MSALSCPECNEALRKRALGQPRLSKKAVICFALAGVVGGAWALLVFKWSPVFLVPRGIGGLALCALFYLAPGILIGVYGASLPKLRTMRCRACGWTEERELG